jgi:hypothetical protein
MLGVTSNKKTEKILQHRPPLLQNNTMPTTIAFKQRCHELQRRKLQHRHEFAIFIMLRTCSIATSSVVAS